MANNQNKDSQTLATQSEIAYHVASVLVKGDDNGFRDEAQTASHVLMIFSAVGKFVGFMFRKTHYETVIADIFGFGTFIRNCTIGKIGVTQFYPSISFQNTLGIVKQYPTQLKEPTQRQEMTLSRLASICSLSDEVTHRLMQAVAKSIVSVQ